MFTDCSLCCSSSSNLTTDTVPCSQTAHCVTAHHQIKPYHCAVFTDCSLCYSSSSSLTSMECSQTVHCVPAHHQALPLCSVHSQYCGSPRRGGLCSRSLDVHTVWSESWTKRISALKKKSVWNTLHDCLLMQGLFCDGNFLAHRKVFDRYWNRKGNGKNRCDFIKCCWLLVRLCVSYLTGDTAAALCIPLRQV